MFRAIKQANFFSCYLARLVPLVGDFRSAVAGRQGISSRRFLVDVQQVRRFVDEARSIVFVNLKNRKYSWAGSEIFWGIKLIISEELKNIFLENKISIFQKLVREGIL